MNEIKQIRKSKGFSQEYMAYKLGISQSMYSRKERGKAAISNREYRLISEILGHTDLRQDWDYLHNYLDA